VTGPVRIRAVLTVRPLLRHRLASGRTAIREGRSRAWDFVELRAEKDVLVVMSNCPQLYNPCSGWTRHPSG